MHRDTNFSQQNPVAYLPNYWLSFVTKRTSCCSASKQLFHLHGHEIFIGDLCMESGIDGNLLPEFPSPIILSRSTLAAPRMCAFEEFDPPIAAPEEPRLLSYSGEGLAPFKLKKSIRARYVSDEMTSNKRPLMVNSKILEIRCWTFSVFLLV